MQPVRTEVRIASGSLRNRKIVCIVHEGLRPTPEMIRKAMFSILGNAIPDRPFFDIFAGTGVTGMEAVSRGASEAIFLERDPKLSAEIVSYLKKFGIESQTQVVRTDAYRWAERWVSAKEPVNFFLSPPFADLESRPEAFLYLVRLLMEKSPEGSVICIQGEDGFPEDNLPDYEKWDIRGYGRNVLMIWVKEWQVASDE